MIYHGESVSIDPATYQGSPQIINVTNSSITSIIQKLREVIAREKQVKKWSRAKKVDLIERGNPRWLD